MEIKMKFYLLQIFLYFTFQVYLTKSNELLKNITLEQYLELKTCLV